MNVKMMKMIFKFVNFIFYCFSFLFLFHFLLANYIIAAKATSKNFPGVEGRDEATLVLP
jgi:hypothetical protein